MKKRNIYYIKWIDSQSEDGWILCNHKNTINSMIIESIGFFIDENKDYIRLALSVGQNENGENKQFNGTMSISKVSILKKKKIK